MKLSLAWIFDHIDADYTKCDVAELVARLNETTAEIETWTSITLDTSGIVLARTEAVDDNRVDVYIPEFDKEVQLPFRADVRAGHYCFLRIEGGSYTWARMSDFGSEKDILLPLVYVDATINAQTWRSAIEVSDYILEIDNKSITHRPDLWSHRGFAREIAALYGLQLKPLEHFLAPMEVQSFPGGASPVNTSAPVITIQDPSVCRTLASTLVETIVWSPSRIPQLTRLCRVDGRPIDALVDSTNYVMFDIGQPMHAFDAEKVRDCQLTARKARIGEHIKLLDESIIELSSHDVVLADGKQPVSLAGIMGSADSAVTEDTCSLLLESGCFSASAIRCTAARYKKRTDAAMRFEKTLDPAQPVYAVRRFMHLLNEYGIPHTSEGHVVVVGPHVQPVRIEVAHGFIEQRLGMHIEIPFMVRTLEQLSFGVDLIKTDNDTKYMVTVPTFRSSKDVTLKEDIVEEVARFFGYKHIQNHAPRGERRPVSTYILDRQRSIKRILSMSAHMRELSSYAFFDESWLRDCGWQPAQSIEALQPVSANWRRLVTTLVPSHLKTVADNIDHHRTMRFFEWARVWRKEYNPIEKMVLSGIFFDQDEVADFYTYKALIVHLFERCAMPVTWKRAEGHIDPWFVNHQTAHIVCEGAVIGTFGMINEEWRMKVAPAGSLCVFELDADFMQSYQPIIKSFVPASRFPDIQHDISVLVPLSVTADMLHAAIKHAHASIVAVSLVDFFQKKEWHAKKSLTFSYIIRDMHKTMTSEDAAIVDDCVQKAVHALGAEIR